MGRKAATPTAKVLAYLRAGRATSVDVAQRRWGLSRDTYNAVIRGLRARSDVLIDADPAWSKSRRRWIASHRLVR